MDEVVAARLFHGKVQVGLRDSEEGDTLLVHGNGLAGPVVTLDVDLIRTVVQGGVVVVLNTDGGRRRLAGMHQLGVGGFSLLFGDDAPVRMLAGHRPRVGGGHQDGEGLCARGRQVVAVARPVTQVHRLDGSFRLLLTARKGHQKDGSGDKYVNDLFHGSGTLILRRLQ